jgi:mRNA interferase RelE/StbE
MYSVRILKAAVGDLQRLDRAVARRIVRRLQWLAENLDAIKPIPLAGELSGLYKLREGDYRIIYEILHEERLILVHCVGHRRDVYRKK